ncbi:MAG: hypothetical protein KF773_42545 [Deltaproteobacteria bacterium]|nr:hypothetical protein [Deltaproteobacteria bacterium]MCW5806538.1 hypothetical protein [Deltaproteobacteria bacterium]
MTVLFVVLLLVLGMTAFTLCTPTGPYDGPVDPDDQPTVTALRVFRVLLILAVLALVWMAGRNEAPPTATSMAARRVS